MAGNHFELRDLRGEPVLVTFWASWCPSCQRETAVIDRITERFGNMKVVGVSMDKNRRQLEGFLKRSGIGWQQVYADKPGQKGWDNPIAKYYGVESIPCSFLVNRHGDVASAGLRGEQEITAAIGELLLPADDDSYAAR